MTRLGEGNLKLRHFHIGTIWVSRVTAGAAFQPRIELAAGCQVQEIPKSQGAPEGIAGFMIAALGGQLRWGSNTGPVVGDLSIPKGLEYLRSNPHSHRHRFTMCCDVPHLVLSRLEAERAGVPPVFWMDLAGSWAIDGGMEPIFQDPWRFEVPTTMWHEFLSTSGYEDFDVVQIRRVLKEGGSLQGAVDHLNAARALVASDPSKAVGICRMVVEAADAELKAQGHQTLSDYLATCTDERRGKHYGRIVSSLKQLTGLSHHHFGQDSVFTRPEALALVRLCEALLLMASELTRPPGRS